MARKRLKFNAWAVIRVAGNDVEVVDLRPSRSAARYWRNWYERATRANGRSGTYSVKPLRGTVVMCGNG